MNRRNFLGRTGKILAAAAFADMLAGCSDFEIEIPCLGPAAAPQPVPGMTYIRASQIGCALNCNLQNGRNKDTGGLATDDGPRINAAMANASASNPITLIVDGPALISGLFLPAGGYWNIAGLGCGTGFFVKSGTNNDGIHNGGPNAAVPSNPGPPAPPRGSNVSLRNFTINGNQGNGYNGVSTSGFTQGVTNAAATVWYFTINLMNLDNIDVENVVVVNAPSFQMRFSNVGNVTISGCVLKSLGPNTDGFHFDGPANDIDISNCDITAGDDAIALNCPEGYTGNISRVNISNCTVNGWTFLLRLHPFDPSVAVKFKVDTVSVSNCSGTLSYAGFLVGHSGGGLPNSIDGLTISNCAFNAPAILEVGANFGNVSLNNVTLTPLASLQVPGFAFARSSAFSTGCTYSGASLVLNSCIVQRKGDPSIPALDIENGSSISNLTLSGYALTGGSSQSTTPVLINIGSGSVGQLVINSVDSADIAGPVSSGGFASIGTVSGSGVLATGWEFPDNVMADDVPYISASDGLPSIKVNGVVEPYSG
jgi:glycosyl hydrolase family 28